MPTFTHKLRETSAACRQMVVGCRAHREPLARGLFSALILYVGKQFSLREIVSYGLYIRQVRSGMPLLISKERSLRKLQRGNSIAQQSKTEDKAQFYRRCLQLGLPIPQTYATFSKGRGSDFSGAPITGRSAWVTFLHQNLPASFIIKDVAGAYGAGFSAFERRGDQYIEVGGDTYDAAGLYERLLQSGGEGKIIQERLFDHPELEALCGYRCLQTIRITTHRRDDGSVRMLFYWLKILAEGNICDNFAGGSTGNLVGVGRRDKGELTGARTLHPSGSGLINVELHPVTGVALRGFRIPLWEEAVALALAAHNSFADFSTLGWDIALTAKGPRLVEANAWWDPPSFAPDIMTAADWQRLFA